MLNEKFVCTYKQVSSFRVESEALRYRRVRTGKQDRTHAEQKVRKNGGNIVSYFCDSSGRVVEIIVGPQKPNEMIAAVHRVTQFNKALASAPASDHSELAKKYVLDLIDENARKEFDEFAESYPDVKEADESALREILTHKKLETPRNNKDLHTHMRAERLRRKNRFRENLLLTKNPLPKIDDIEKPVFECMTGNKYKVPSPEYKQRLQQFASANKSGKFVLAVMLDDQRNPWLQPNVNKKPKYVAPDINAVTSFSAICKKEQFAIVGVTHDDLFRILSELGKKPMRFKDNRTTQKKGVGFIVFDRDAKVMKFLPPDTGLSDVSRAMRLAVNK